jgi:hypothetical protein
MPYPTLPQPFQVTPIPEFQGPQGQKCIVAIGWHVDAESGPIATDPRAAQHLAALSEGAYGVSTALPRILELHHSLNIPAFFFPGYVADLHSDAVEAIAAAGHEIAHHGYLHKNCFFLDQDAQRQVFLKGIAALVKYFSKVLPPFSELLAKRRLAGAHPAGELSSTRWNYFASWVYSMTVA